MVLSVFAHVGVEYTRIAFANAHEELRIFHNLYTLKEDEICLSMVQSFQTAGQVALIVEDRIEEYQFIGDISQGSLFVWKKHLVAAANCESIEVSNAFVEPIQPAMMAANMNLDKESNVVPLVSNDGNPPLESFSSQAKANFDTWAASQTSFVIHDDEYETLRQLKSEAVKPATQKTRNQLMKAKKFGISVDGKRLTKVVEGRLLTVAKFSEVYDIICRAHTENCHVGIQKTFCLVNDNYYGVTRGFVKKILAACAVCAHMTIAKTRAPLKPIVSERPWQRIQIDLIDMRFQIDSLSDPAKKYMWILHAKDHFSKFSALWALERKQACIIARKLRKFFLQFSPPEILQCDNGREFKGVVVSLMAELKVEIILGRPRTPRTQGLVEQANGEVEIRLAKWKIQTGRQDWKNSLPLIACSLNKTS